MSPDSKHVAYVASVGDKLLVVVDGEEGKQYWEMDHVGVRLKGENLQEKWRFLLTW